MSSIDDLAGRAGAAARREAEAIAATLEPPTSGAVPPPPGNDGRVARQRVIAALVGAAAAAAAVTIFVVARRDDASSVRIEPGPVATSDPEVTPAPTTATTTVTTTAVATTATSISTESTVVPTTAAATATAVPTSISPSTPASGDLAACMEQPVSPPSLPDGSPPVTETTTGAADQIAVRWTGADPSRGVTQQLGMYWPRDTFDSVGFGPGYVVREPYEAAVSVVSAAATEVRIDIASFADGCVRRYRLDGLADLDRALAYATQWVDSLAATAQPIAPLSTSIRPPVPFVAVRYSQGLTSPQIWHLSADGVGALPARVATFSAPVAPVTLADGSVLHLGVNTVGGRCDRTPLTIARAGVDSTVHPDLTYARSFAATPSGVVIAERDVCPDGAKWGDPGTRWELVRVDLSAENPELEVLLTRDPDPSLVQFSSPETVYALGHSFVAGVSDDGRFAALQTLFNVEQGNYQIVRLDAGAPAQEVDVASECASAGDIIGWPAFVGGSTVLVARRCEGTTLVELVDLDSGDVVESTNIGDALSGYSNSIGLDVFVQDGSVWTIATWNRDVEAPAEAVLLHNGEVAVLTRPGFDGFAFSEASLGFGQQ